MNKKFFLILISIPGLLSLLPKLNETYATIIAQSPELVISYNTFLIISLVQSCILIIASILLGNWATKKFDWHDDALNAIQANNTHALQQATKTQLIPSLRYSIPASLCFVATLHLLLFPLLDHTLVTQLNDFSISSLVTRIFYGGIIEEILLRWGMLSALVLLGLTLFKGHVHIVWWTAIIISALLFGFGHVPFYLATVTKPTIAMILLIIGANSYAGIFLGWVFKRFGLISAMIAHMLFHVTWFLVYLINRI